MSVDTYIQITLNAGMAVMAFLAARTMRDEPEKALEAWGWRGLGFCWFGAALKHVASIDWLPGWVATVLALVGIPLMLAGMVIGLRSGVSIHYRDLHRRWRDDGLGVSKPLGTWTDRSLWPVVFLAIVGLGAFFLYRNAGDLSLHALIGLALLLCVAILVAVWRMLRWLQVCIDAAVIRHWSSRLDNGPGITGAPV